MTIFRFKMPVIALGLLAVACPASANRLIELPSAQMLERADLVAIATPVNCGPPKNRDFNAPCELKIVQLIKGEPITSVIFNRYDGADEDMVKCCESSHVYLIYLRRGDDQWWSVNGQFGVRDLEQTGQGK